jgi:hypothetical protein
LCTSFASSTGWHARDGSAIRSTSLRPNRARRLAANCGIVSLWNPAANIDPRLQNGLRPIGRHHEDRLPGRRRPVLQRKPSV